MYTVRSLTSSVFAESKTRSRHRKLSVFDGTFGSAKEIHEHDYGNIEVVLGANHSGNLDDKDDDYAFPVYAVHEDTDPNINV